MQFRISRPYFLPRRFLKTRPLPPRWDYYRMGARLHVRIIATLQVCVCVGGCPMYLVMGRPGNRFARNRPAAIRYIIILQLRGCDRVGPIGDVWAAFDATILASWGRSKIHLRAHLQSEKRHRYEANLVYGKRRFAQGGNALKARCA